VTTRIAFCFMVATRVAARARRNNRIATKGGFVRTNGGLGRRSGGEGGYIWRKRCT
jgi:hypothetical protein